MSDSPRLCRCGHEEIKHGSSRGFCYCCAVYPSQYDPAPLVRGPGASVRQKEPCACTDCPKHQDRCRCSCAIHGPAPVGEPAAAAPDEPHNHASGCGCACPLHPGACCECQCAVHDAPPLIRDHVPPEHPALEKCWTCGAMPTHDCICNGTGLHVEEVANMRLEIFRLRGDLPSPMLQRERKQNVAEVLFAPALIRDHVPVHRTGDGGECQHITHCLMPDEAHERRRP